MARCQIPYKHITRHSSGQQNAMRFVRYGCLLGYALGNVIMIHTSIRIFIGCNNCRHEAVFHQGHREALAKRIGKRPTEIDIEDMLVYADNFRCKECGAKGVTFRTERKRKNKKKMIYVASGRQYMAEPIFHKNTCGWVAHIDDTAALTFLTRQSAITSGFRPCNFCKP
jgi:hypothetical protein